MTRLLLRAIAVTMACVIATPAAARDWRRGIWVEVKIKRPKFVFGVQPRNPVTQLPEMTVIRTYVIDADDVRLELKEPTPAPGRSVDALVGDPVTFALEKNTVYIRGDDGTEYRLQVTKRGSPPKDEDRRR
jgi:hypothetical protein